LLWDHAGIPLLRPPAVESSARRAQEAAEKVAFFWMMAAVTAKYIGREDGVFVNEWLEHLHGLAEEVERQISGHPWRYRRGSALQLQMDRESQLRTLRGQCMRMVALTEAVAKMGGRVPLAPLETVEVVFDMVENHLRADGK
jgi:hypothetical protein